MKQTELIKLISERAHVPKHTVEVMLTATANVVAEALERDGAVTLPDIVKLSTKRREAYTGRNPKTGAAVDVPAKTVIVVKPVKALSDHIA